MLKSTPFTFRSLTAWNNFCCNVLPGGQDVLASRRTGEQDVQAPVRPFPPEGTGPAVKRSRLKRVGDQLHSIQPGIGESYGAATSCPAGRTYSGQDVQAGRTYWRAGRTGGQDVQAGRTYLVSIDGVQRFVSADVQNSFRDCG
jgi:hypothetical protein